MTVEDISSDIKDSGSDFVIVGAYRFGKVIMLYAEGKASTKVPSGDYGIIGSVKSKYTPKNRTLGIGYITPTAYEHLVYVDISANGYIHTSYEGYTGDYTISFSIVYVCN